MQWKGQNRKQTEKTIREVISKRRDNGRGKTRSRRKKGDSQTKVKGKKSKNRG